MLLVLFYSVILEGLSNIFFVRPYTCFVPVSFAIVYSLLQIPAVFVYQGRLAYQFGSHLFLKRRNKATEQMTVFSRTACSYILQKTQIVLYIGLIYREGTCRDIYDPAGAVNCLLLPWIQASASQ